MQIAILALLALSAHAFPLPLPNTPCSRNIEDFGAVAEDKSEAACIRNAAAVSSAFASNCETVVPSGKNFFIIGGISARSMQNVTLRMEGNLTALPYMASWPFQAVAPSPDAVPLPGGEKIADKPTFQDIVLLRNISGLHVTGGGLIDGNGVKWWNMEVLPQVFGHLAGVRPMTLRILESTHILVDHISLHNSPFWTFLMQDVAGAEVSNIRVTVDRQVVKAIKAEWRKSIGVPPSPFFPADEDGAVPLEPQDLNTDGIDCTGRDIYIHDSYVENDDDSIAVKPCSGATCTLSNCTTNIVIERMTLVGFGASIGSVPPGVPAFCVQNVVFRNISMPKTGKGIYVKSNPSCGVAPGAKAILADITFEDVVISEPRWWPIWIGPQQQHQPGTEVGERCALTFPLSGHCPTQGCADFRNITLRRVDVYHPWLSAGVVLGNSTNPMQGVVFDQVVFHQQSRIPYGKHYLCDNIEGEATGCVPTPECFKSG